MTDIDIRPAGIADLPDVMLVMRAAFDPAYGEAWTEAQCAGILGMPGTWMMVARSGSVPVGFALARSVAGEAELLLLAVSPGHRRSGVGRALLTGVIDDARQSGVMKLHLEVRDSNTAINLYRVFGFRQAGVRKDYYRGKDDQHFDALTFSYILPNRS